ncbi:hypothetical protein E7W39_03805 [Cronobacter sakazakii]|uniref:hypothetical protein n=1 Tax=Enterobacteriaceae TaxID=543 RepID=UPI0004984C1D|nr:MULTISPECIES: hypothetical protein [Enterobacteriaceae]EGT4277866.1 hypothetical protein [Cronobacter sakazakii]EGT5185998.1 hypothetical protein [Cronobacter sakazakii]EGT5666969.1 hypothetical protein [Cronobacter sakazakii]EGZ7002234.1 hypothetical protein [Cronobacter sakazakii]EGZ7011457.1 hypothetical protein [Cronobacter sakazakii]
MNTSRYALSRSERGWLAYSFAFVMAAVIFGFLMGRIGGVLPATDQYGSLQDYITLLLISLGGGFLITAAGHYAIRQGSVRAPGEAWHEHD